MSELTWGDPGTHFFEAGVDRGVFYPKVGPGVAWHGLTSVDATPSEAEEDVQYYEGQKYRQRKLRESFSATIRAFTYPVEFEEYNGYSDSRLVQMRRKAFDFCFRTGVGNDIVGDLSYKIHLVYNALATPSHNMYKTNEQEVTPLEFEWDISTMPIPIPGLKSTAHIVIVPLLTTAATIEPLEDILYGTADTDPRMPTIEEVLEMFEKSMTLQIIDHGDGTWTAIGPDEMVYMANVGTTNEQFVINSPSATYLDLDTYIISSLQ